MNTSARIAERTARTARTAARDTRNVDVVLHAITVVGDSAVRVIFKPADATMAVNIPARARDSWHVEIDGDEREDGALRFGHKRAAVKNVTAANNLANKWLREARAAVGADVSAETFRAYREA